MKGSLSINHFRSVANEGVLPMKFYNLPMGARPEPVTVYSLTAKEFLAEQGSLKLFRQTKKSTTAKKNIIITETEQENENYEILPVMKPLAAKPLRTVKKPPMAKEKPKTRDRSIENLFVTGFSQKILPGTMKNNSEEDSYSQDIEEIHSYIQKWNLNTQNNRPFTAKRPVTAKKHSMEQRPLTAQRPFTAKKPIFEGKFFEENRSVSEKRPFREKKPFSENRPVSTTSGPSGWNSLNTRNQGKQNLLGYELKGLVKVPEVYDLLRLGAYERAKRREEIEKIMDMPNQSLGLQRPLTTENLMRYSKNVSVKAGIEDFIQRRLLI